MAISTDTAAGDDIRQPSGEHGRPGREKQRVRIGIVAALLCVLMVVEVLNVSGFCYRKMRYVSEKELINSAVMLNLARHDPHGERNKMYETLDDFFRANPNCCKVSYYNQFIAPLARLFGLYEVAVSVHYKISDTNEKYKYYSVDVLMSACGGIVRKLGTAEDHGPVGST
jgi:hypothetical protein